MEDHSQIAIHENQGRLTATIRRAPFLTVLKQLEQSLSIAITNKHPKFNPLIDLSFNNLTREEGLKRILNASAFVFLYGQKNHPDRITGVIILSAGDPEWQKLPQRIKPFHHNPANLEEERIILEQIRKYALESPDPDQRIEGLKTYAFEASHNKDIVDLLGLALSDPDIKVRKAALRLLKDTDNPLPRESLDRLILNPAEDKGLRRDALEFLTDREEEGSADILFRVMDDGDAALSRRARELAMDLQLIPFPQKNR